MKHPKPNICNICHKPVEAGQIISYTGEDMVALKGHSRCVLDSLLPEDKRKLEAVKRTAQVAMDWQLDNIEYEK